MAAAEQKAREIGVDMDIAIVDDGGHLLMFHRMDNARLTSIDIAVSKVASPASTLPSARPSRPPPPAAPRGRMRNRAGREARPTASTSATRAAS
jgi:hypothetical protein